MGDSLIADVATWPWVTAALPHLRRWIAAAGARPAAQEGRAVPQIGGSKEVRSEAITEPARKILA